jgi:hypothetical protein
MNIQVVFLVDVDCFERIEPLETLVVVCCFQSVTLVLVDNVQLFLDCLSAWLCSCRLHLNTFAFFNLNTFFCFSWSFWRVPVENIVFYSKKFLIGFKLNSICKEFETEFDTWADYVDNIVDDVETAAFSDDNWRFLEIAFHIRISFGIILLLFSLTT